MLPSSPRLPPLPPPSRKFGLPLDRISGGADDASSHGERGSREEVGEGRNTPPPPSSCFYAFERGLGGTGRPLLCLYENSVPGPTGTVGRKPGCSMFRPFGTQGTDLVAAEAFPTVTLADPLRLLIVYKRHGIRSLSVSSSLFRLLSQSLSRFPSPISVLFFSRPRFFSLSLFSPPSHTAQRLLPGLRPQCRGLDRPRGQQVGREGLRG